MILNEDDSQILLGKKERGVGKGYWNGFGGHIEDGETLTEAAIREVWEETSLIVCVNYLDFIGVNYFVFPESESIFRVYNFKYNQKQPLLDFLPHCEDGEFLEFKWFGVNDIPYDRMWQDDKYWFPYMLKKESFEGFYFFDSSNNMQSYYIRSGIV